MKLELISFKLCPFAQRAVILLNLQNIDFKTTYINPMDPPNWFKKISPTGEVPLLKVDDKIVFESSVIGEFINDIGALDLYPKDAISKANNRSWVQFSSLLFNDLSVAVTGNEDEFNTSKASLFAKLDKIEIAKSDNKFFNGNNFTIIDAAIAPFFMRLAWINKFTNNTISIIEFKHLNAWSDAILAVKIVKTSVIKNLDDVYYSNIEAREGYLSTLLID